MKKGLIIGFEYKNGDYIPGIIVDLYQVYSFFKKNNIKNVLVITDIQYDYNTTVLKSSILNKVVDSGVISFIDDIKTSNEYVNFENLGERYDNDNHKFSRKPINIIISIFCQNTDELFVYFTGHGKNNHLILPNSNILSMTHFRDNILDNCLKDSNILFVMDCCDGNGLKLPFVLIDDIYRLVDQPEFVKQQVICISSSQHKENSTATQIGSLFTRYLFKLLDDNTLSLSSILKKIRKKISKKYLIDLVRETNSHSLEIDESINNIIQTSTIHSSYPILKVPWGFIFNKSSLSVTIDNYTSLVEITIRDW